MGDQTVQTKTENAVHNNLNQVQQSLEQLMFST